MWNRLARYYDWQLALERRAIARAVDLAAARPGERLLDLATGTGAVLRELARRRSRPRSAVGVDSAEQMLRRAPELPQGWELVKADVRALPFPDSSFDVATAAYLLHLLGEDDLTAALDEARRVLVPGGRFVTVTPVSPPSRLARPYRGVIGQAVRLAPDVLRGLRLFDPRAALMEVGFTVLLVSYVSRGYPSLCVLCERPGA